jgi:hypothetical protein
VIDIPRVLEFYPLFSGEDVAPRALASHVDFKGANLLHGKHFFGRKRDHGLPTGLGGRAVVVEIILDPLCHQAEITNLPDGQHLGAEAVALAGCGLVLEAGIGRRESVATSLSGFWDDLNVDGFVEAKETLGEQPCRFDDTIRVGCPNFDFAGVGEDGRGKFWVAGA